MTWKQWTIFTVDIALAVLFGFSLTSFIDSKNVLWLLGVLPFLFFLMIVLWWMSRKLGEISKKLKYLADHLKGNIDE